MRSPAVACGVRSAFLRLHDVSRRRNGLSSLATNVCMPPAMKIWKFATISLLVLGSFAADNVAPSKTELEGMYDKAFKEFDANNYDAALKDLDAIDARQPDLAASHNLSDVILIR